MRQWQYIAVLCFIALLLHVFSAGSNLQTAAIAHAPASSAAPPPAAVSPSPPSPPPSPLPTQSTESIEDAPTVARSHRIHRRGHNVPATRGAVIHHHGRRSHNNESSAASHANGGGCRSQRRLLHWNILDGGGSRRDGIASYIRDGNFDIVTLNELNGFSEEKLNSFGSKCGLPYTQLLSKSAYKLGILSKHEITPHSHERGPEFAHGLLCVEVLDVVLCVAHLNPHDSRRRVHEAKRILTKHAKPQMDSNKGFLLVGDLNTLSPLDKAHHELAGLTSKIRTGPYAKPLGKKFLNHQVSATHKQASSVSDLPSSHNPLLSLLCYCTHHSAPL